MGVGWALPWSDGLIGEEGGRKIGVDFKSVLFFRLTCGSSSMCLSCDFHFMSFLHVDCIPPC